LTKEALIKLRLLKFCQAELKLLLTLHFILFMK